jgi:hypothetical protein
MPAAARPTTEAMSSARSRSGRDATRTPPRGRDQEDVQHATTLDEMADLVVARMPAGLIDPAGAARVRASVGGVPAELVARLGLEFDLPGAAADASALFSADSETGGMQMLAGRHPLVSLPDELARAESWAPVVRFCGQREPGLLLHRATRDVWVDLARRDDPSFAFGLRLAGLPEATRRPLEVVIRALELGFEALRGAPLEAPALTSMRALLRHLPETARVDRAGLMAGLPDDVRLWLARLAPAQIGDLVEATRGRDEARQIRDLLADLAPAAGAVGLRLDVRGGVDRALGLVCTVDQAGSPAQVAARWLLLLDRLVAAGLCTAGKRDALLACHGVLHETAAERWPAHLRRLSEMLGDGSESVLRWRLHQVLVECDGGEPVHATANVVAAPGWLRR